MTKVLETPIIIVSDAKITRTDLNNEVYGKQLSKFIDNMEARFDKKDLDFFYNNINRINFSSDTFDSIEGGGYDPVTNNIILNDKFNEKLDKSLTHELSHSASNYYDQHHQD